MLETKLPMPMLLPKPLVVGMLMRPAYSTNADAKCRAANATANSTAHTTGPERVHIEPERRKRCDKERGVRGPAQQWGGGGEGTVQGGAPRRTNMARQVTDLRFVFCVLVRACMHFFFYCSAVDPFSFIYNTFIFGDEHPVKNIFHV